MLRAAQGANQAVCWRSAERRLSHSDALEYDDGEE